MDLAALIAKLESASEGSRELDAEIDDPIRAARLGWPVAKAARLRGGVTWDETPRYTTSLDAALTLVPEGWHWSVSHKNASILCENFDDDHSRVFWSPTLPRRRGIGGGFNNAVGTVATPAIALCIVSLRARQALPQAPQS